jgi:hypothetical protein
MATDSSSEALPHCGCAGAGAVFAGEEPERNRNDYSGCRRARRLGKGGPPILRAAALRICHQHAGAAGRLTGLCGMPRRADQVALSLERLVGVEEIDAPGHDDGARRNAEA